MLSFDWLKTNRCSVYFFTTRRNGKQKPIENPPISRWTRFSFSVATFPVNSVKSISQFSPLYLSEKQMRSAKLGKEVQVNGWCFEFLATDALLLPPSCSLLFVEPPKLLSTNINRTLSSHCSRRTPTLCGPNKTVLWIVRGALTSFSLLFLFVCSVLFSPLFIFSLWHADNSLPKTRRRVRCVRLNLESNLSSKERRSVIQSPQTAWVTVCFLLISVCVNACVCVCVCYVWCPHLHVCVCFGVFIYKCECVCVCVYECTYICLC